MTDEELNEAEIFERVQRETRGLPILERHRLRSCQTLISIPSPAMATTRCLPIEVYQLGRTLIPGG